MWKWTIRKKLKLFTNQLFANFIWSISTHFTNSPFYNENESDDKSSFVDSLCGGADSDEDEGEIENETDEELSGDDDDQDGDDLESEEPKIEEPILFSTNSGTTDAAIATKFQLKLIENILSCRIKLQKIMKETATLGEEITPFQEKNLLKIEEKYNRILKILDNIESRDGYELITNTFEKTKIMGGFNKFEKDPVLKIQEIIGDRERLVERTRVRRDNSGNQQEQNDSDSDDDHTQEKKNSNFGPDPRIFDDSDFYITQLKEIISSKSYNKEDSSDNSLAITQKWMLQQQKIRSNSRKRNAQGIPSKERKGKKINYQVHKKMINFLAPNEAFGVGMTHQGRDLLFASLFQ